MKRHYTHHGKRLRILEGTDSAEMTNTRFSSAFSKPSNILRTGMVLADYNRNMPEADNHFPVKGEKTQTG